MEKLKEKLSLEKFEEKANEYKIQFYLIVYLTLLVWFFTLNIYLKYIFVVLCIGLAVSEFFLMYIPVFMNLQSEKKPEILLSITEEITGDHYFFFYLIPKYLMMLNLLFIFTLLVNVLYFEYDKSKVISEMNRFSFIMFSVIQMIFSYYFIFKNMQIKSENNLTIITHYSNFTIILIFMLIRML